MEPLPPPEDSSSPPEEGDESAEEAPAASSPDESRADTGPPAVPTPLDMVKKYALPVVFVLAVFAMYFKGESDEALLAQQGSGLAALQGQIMGTSFDVQIIAQMDPNAEELLWQNVNEAMQGVDLSMSTYKPESELSLLNEHVEIETPFEISPVFLTVLEAAQSVHSSSGGAFDPTVGPLVNRWGFGPGDKPQEAPSEEELESLRERVGLDKLQVLPAADTEMGLVTKGSPDLQIDLSAIAKGYAVDRVAAVIHSLGYTNWKVEIGGEIRTSGTNPQGLPWTIGIETPVVGQQDLWMTLPLNEMSLATSGDYRNIHQIDGMTISHTIDPRTGRPIDHGLASVSVLHSDCLYADAWATALMVLGLEEGLQIAEERGLQALFIQRGDDASSLEETSTSAWKKYISVHAPETVE